MFALVDCNNFYASCERVFRPDLIGKPIVVLSSNDGCVIARSNESKQLGIGMAEPFFKIKELCKKARVQVFSSNFTLYGDFSQRVMAIIRLSWPEVEVYSIDEAFLDLTSMPREEQEAFCLTLQQKILKHTGIPTSIGLGATKTLAKLANHICKKELKTPVYTMKPDDFWLKHISVADIWGVGKQSSAALITHGIKTVEDLIHSDPKWLKSRFNVCLMRTIMELQGVRRFALTAAEPRESILASRSFGQAQTELTPIAEALSTHCRRVYGKLREQHSQALQVTVFLTTNRFRSDVPQYKASTTQFFITATDDIRLITKAAKQGLKELYRAGFHYKKVGVCLTGLSDNKQQAIACLEGCSKSATIKKEQLLAVFDSIDKKFGRKAIQLGAQGLNTSWASQSTCRSPAYTTRWSDLATVKAT